MKSFNKYVNEALIKKDTKIISMPDKIKICFKIDTYTDNKFVERCKNTIDDWCEKDEESIEGPIVYQKDSKWFDDEKIKKINIKIKEINDEDIESSKYNDHIGKFSGVIYSNNHNDSLFYKDNTLGLEHKMMFIFFIKP